MTQALSPVELPACVLCEDVIGCSLSFAWTDKGVVLRLRSVTSDPRTTPWIPLQHASHSQRAVALISVQVALQTRLGGWRHVFIDDLESLQAERRTKFVAAMAELVAQGDLDNFVGACVDDGWRPDDVQVLELTHAAG